MTLKVERDPKWRGHPVSLHLSTEWAMPGNEEAADVQTVDLPFELKGKGNWYGVLTQNGVYKALYLGDTDANHRKEDRFLRKYPGLVRAEGDEKRLSIGESMAVFGLIITQVD